MSENPLMELRYALDRSDTCTHTGCCNPSSYRLGGPGTPYVTPVAGSRQRYCNDISRECDISTQRMRSTNILDAPKRPSAQHPYDHVILVSEEFDALIDPTWTQFAALAGLHSLAVRNLPEEMRAPLYPSAEQIALAPIADATKKWGKKLLIIV